jgi:hypothetical protein
MMMELQIVVYFRGERGLPDYRVADFLFAPVPRIGDQVSLSDEWWKENEEYMPRYYESPIMVTEVKIGYESEGAYSAQAFCDVYPQEVKRKKK